MKKLIIAAFLVLISLQPAYANPAAPYTKQAEDKLTNALSEKGGLVPPIKKNPTNQDSLCTILTYFDDLYASVGYDMRKSVDKYVHDSNTNPDVFQVPPLFDYAYCTISLVENLSKMIRTDEDLSYMSQFFSPETIHYFQRIEKKNNKASTKEIKLKQGDEIYIVEGKSSKYLIVKPQGQALELREAAPYRQIFVNGNIKLKQDDRVYAVKGKYGTYLMVGLGPKFDFSLTKDYEPSSDIPTKSSEEIQQMFQNSNQEFRQSMGLNHPPPDNSQVVPYNNNQNYTDTMTNTVTPIINSLLNRFLK